MRNQIENYFSGCMTLTLKPFENIEKQDYICLVDLDEKSSNLIKENTSREIKEITHDVKQDEIKEKPFEKRMQEVEELLKTYQSAHIVFTNRLHVALPCLALGTPVVLIHKKNFEEDRLGTYLQYVTSYTDIEFEKNNVKEIIENPKINSEEYLTIRDSLIQKCEAFIQKCEKEELKEEDLPEIEEYEQYTKRLKWYQQLHEDIRVKAKKNIYESEKRYKEYEEIIRNSNTEWKAKYEDLQNKYQNLEQDYQREKEELTSIYESRGWKLLEKIRKSKPKK